MKAEVSMQACKASVQRPLKSKAIENICEEGKSIVISLSLFLSLGHVLEISQHLTKRLSPQSRSPMPLTDWAVRSERTSCSSLGTSYSPRQRDILCLVSMYGNRRTVFAPEGLGVGQLIGKKGSNVRHLQSRSGARVNVNADAGTVIVSGSSSDVSGAVELLEGQFASWRSSGVPRCPVLE